MLSRRAILMSGSAAALVTGLGGCDVAVDVSKATEPWVRAGESFGDPRLDALAYGILAPNPHNRQPWQFDLVDDDKIDVYCDLERRLPHTDPYDRQITIGFGCMLELVSQAAAEKGYTAAITGFPDGAPQPRLNGNRIAQITFARDTDAQRDPLFASVRERRSNKDPFDTERSPTPAIVDQVVNAKRTDLTVEGTTDRGRIKTFVDMAWKGFVIEMETDVTRRESVDLMRIGNKAVVENPDGIDMSGTAMTLMKSVGIVSHESLDTPGSTAYNSGLEMYHPIIHSAQGFVWITAPENTRASQLKAGYDWVRMNLAAQKINLSIHPLSQVLQEYSEMADLYRQIHDELGVPDGVVHMFGRVGYGKTLKPSPRWPLEAKLINT